MEIILSKTGIRALNVLAIMAVIPWPKYALLPLFMFDAPGSGSTIPTVMLAISIWVYPFTTIGGAIEAFRGCKENNYNHAVKATKVSVGSVLFVAFWYFILVAYCDGKFTC
jgi:hypothetical protein